MSVVVTANGSTQSSASFSGTGAIPAGSLSVVVISVASGVASTVSSVSDGTQAYTRASRQQNGDVDTDIWYVANSSAIASPTYSATFSGGTQGWCAQSLYATGVKTSSPVDITGGGTSSASPVSASFTTTAGNDLIIIGVGAYSPSGSGWNPTISSYTQLGSTLFISGFTEQATFYSTSNSSGAQSPSASWSSTTATSYAMTGSAFFSIPSSTGFNMPLTGF